MDEYCCRCGQTTEKKEIVLFGVPSSKNLQWHVDFIDRLGIQGGELSNIKICSNHFNPEDLELIDDELVLKKNALPIDNETEETAASVLHTEISYVNHHPENSDLGNDYELESDDVRELAPLEPLIEYVYEGNLDAEEENGERSVEEMARAEMHDDENVVRCEGGGEEDGAEGISIVKEEIEPLMPFFLTSSPLFTIVNEDSVVGETIILQIDNVEDNQDPLPDPKLLHDLQKFLCTSKDKSDIEQYVCEICDNVYGCLNCLKSHYGTLHLRSRVMRYKCDNSYYPSYNLTCSVCELMFESNSEVVAHQLTHTVNCDICHSGFNRQTNLSVHYKTEHGKDVEVPFECELCKMMFQYPKGLSRHYQVIHKMVLCYLCKVKFGSVGELQKHEQIHYQKLAVLPYACSKCDKAFKKISDIAVHIRHDHCKRDDDKNVYGVDKVVSKNVNDMPKKKKAKVKK